MSVLDDVKTTHQDCARFNREAKLIEMMMDEYGTKKSCIEDQGAYGSYLKKLLSHKREDAEKEKDLYESYVDSAFLPEHIVSDAADEMIGICFKTKATIKLPENIKHLEAHANTKGDSLLAVVTEILRDVISTRRAVISTDYDAEEDAARISHTPARNLYNWRRNNSGYTMMVFAETYLNEEGEAREQARHYSIEDGVLVVSVCRKGENGEWFEYQELDKNGHPVPQPTLPNKKPYDYIPVRVAQTNKPALLGMARTVLKGFQVSADYYGLLKKFTPTLVLRTEGNADSLQTGFENGIIIGQKDNAELLQVGTEGSEPNKEAMENLFDSAVDQGVRLISVSGSTESGKALYLRNANKQIKIDAVAYEVSKEVTEALRVAAILQGDNPDDVEFALIVELVEDPVDIEEMKEMREAVVDGSLLKWSDYLLKANANKIITLEKQLDGTFDTEKYIQETIAENRSLDAIAEPDSL